MALDIDKKALLCNVVSGLVREGDKVVIQRDDKYQVINVRSSGFINLEKVKIPISGIIGFPIGTSFLFDGNIVTPLETSSKETNLDEMNFDSSKDNRHLNDCSENQYLSADQIHAMKSSGASGNEILTKLVEQSSTFHLKTKYSQEKYIKKKKRMYLCVFTVRPFTARTIVDMNMVTGRYKSSSLRYDSLAQLIMYANVHASSTVLLVETYAGLISQAVLERLGHRSLGGRLIQFFHGTNPPIPEIPNLSAYSEIISIRFSDVSSLLLTGKYVREHVSESYCSPSNSPEREGESIKNIASPPNPKIARLENEVECKDEEEPVEVSSVCVQNAPANRYLKRKLKRSLLSSFEIQKAKAASLKLRLDALERARTILCPPDTSDVVASETVELPDSLIVATKFYPVDITLLLMQFLPPGRPFVVHCHLITPLVELFNILKRRGSCAQLTLLDSWLRPIQVLPDRTHPEVKMTPGGGGFILRGYTVQRFEDESALHTQAKITSATKDIFSQGLINFADLSP